jgi:ATP-dependent DNA ligase
MKYFYPEKPMLFNINSPAGELLINEMDKTKNYIVEKKYNGIRLELFYTNGNFEFWNRHGEMLSYRPDKNMMMSLEMMSMKLDGDCIFDGELRHNKVKGINNKIILYDVFMWNGNLLTNVKFEDRRKILQRILSVDSNPLGITKQYLSNFKDNFENFILDIEIEGIVVKRKNGVLNLSRTRNQDSRWMFKARRPSKNYMF